MDYLGDWSLRNMLNQNKPPDPTKVPVFADVVCDAETWLTVEICVRADSPKAAQLKEICDEMLRRGLPVYVSVSKRGTPYKAG